MRISDWSSDFVSSYLASTIRSASDTRLPPAAEVLNCCWIASSALSTFANCAGWFAGQSFCGARRMRAPLAQPRLSLPRKLAADAQARSEERRDGKGCVRKCRQWWWADIEKKKN